MAYNIRKKTKKLKVWKLLYTATICIVLVICFGLLGASYASWTQAFNIFGTISTGYLDIVIRDVSLESSDGYETCSFSAIKEGNAVDLVTMNVVTGSNPFGALLNFTVENTGTLPVVCSGIDKNVEEGLEVIIIDAPSSIEPGQTANIKVRIVKGYCNNFEFSTFLKFEQVM